MTEPLVITVKEAAELLRVSNDIVYARIAEGVIPTVDWLGDRIIRIPRQALLDLVNGRIPTPASGASLEPGGPPSSGDAGALDGAAEEPSEPVRLSAGSGSDRGTPDEGLRSTVANLDRSVPQESVRRHPSAHKATPELEAATNGQPGRR